MIHKALLLLLLSTVVHAEIRVSTDFEGGNAEVVTLDHASQTLRIMPKLHEGRGWPCWWYFQVGGLKPGGPFTLEVQAQTKPFREDQVLAAAWCQPKHAWLSLDGETWSPSEAGTLSADKVMRYTLKPTTASLRLAWGPPFVPADAEKLLTELATKLPESKRFELSKTREGRTVNGIRIGDENAPHQVWVGARHHAWEAGGSQVGRGFIRWYASDEAKALRAKTCLHYIPIMDVDNASIGAGGKEAVPRDHNRDWADAPIYPEVAAAQKMIGEIHQKHGLDAYIDLHNPGANDPIFFFGPFAFERMTGIQQRNYRRWMELAAANITTPRPVEPKYRFANYVKTEEERGRMSSGWVRNHTGDFTISVTLETGWNSPLMSIEGYSNIGAGLGRALAAYLAENPRRE
ncbi:MAG: hypothetical protein JNN17_06350 [Verrucomicrobiaceae bacterium]|nr:hypothetical protein [Verrucomicrobiaceae bacterium]